MKFAQGWITCYAVWCKNVLTTSSQDYNHWIRECFLFWEVIMGLILLKYITNSKCNFVLTMIMKYIYNQDNTISINKLLYIVVFYNTHWRIDKRANQNNKYYKLFSCHILSFTCSVHYRYDNPFALHVSTVAA